MKKRIAALFIVIILSVVFVPVFSQAAITPYFMAINDTLLPFNDDTMPYISGNDFFIPENVFNEYEGLNLWAIGSSAQGYVRLYRGTRYVDFYTTLGETKNQDGNTLNWPSARRINRRFFFPLRQVCEYFGLTWSIEEIRRDVIPDEQMYLVRIISSASLTGQNFITRNRDAFRAAYNAYYAPAETPSTPTAGVTITPPSVEPPPSYSDVTVHLSFYDISAGSAEWILDLLEIQAASGYYSCFFVNADDIVENPGLIRRMLGAGHTIGICLKEGTYEEYLEISALLFESVKIRTVLVTITGAAREGADVAVSDSLVYWESPRDTETAEEPLPEEEAGEADSPYAYDITRLLPTESGARKNLMLSCSESAASELPRIIAYLMDNEYNIEAINETVVPVN